MFMLWVPILFGIVHILAFSYACLYEAKANTSWLCASVPAVMVPPYICSCFSVYNRFREWEKKWGQLWGKDEPSCVQQDPPFGTLDGREVKCWKPVFLRIRSGYALVFAFMRLGRKKPSE